jgi:pyruvate formate lyase activating enzyme
MYKNSNDKITCLLCDKYCTLKEAQSGFCGVNENQDGKLHTKVYGYFDAINIDPIEKKPLYHFLPHTKTFSIGSVGCNYRCPFCQNYHISQTNKIKQTKYLSPTNCVENAIYYGCDSISFTYNEPTIFYPYAKDVAPIAHKRGLKTVFVSNANMSKEVAYDMIDTIDAINADIKSFDPLYYKKVLKGDLHRVLDNLTILKSGGIHIEITTLVIVGENDHDIDGISKFIYTHLGSDTPYHISAFHPDYKMLETMHTPKELLLQLQTIAKNNGLKNVYLGNVR